MNPYACYLMVSFITVLASLPTFAGITSGNKILTPDGLIGIDELRRGAYVDAYHHAHAKRRPLRIKQIITKTTAQRVVITTEQDIITASPDQLFYDIEARNYVPARLLKKGSLLLNASFKTALCKDITVIDGPTTSYEVIMRWSEYFFVGKAGLLTASAESTNEPTHVRLERATNVVKEVGTVVCSISFFLFIRQFIHIFIPPRQ